MADNYFHGIQPIRELSFQTYYTYILFFVHDFSYEMDYNYK